MVYSCILKSYLADGSGLSASEWSLNWSYSTAGLCYGIELRFFTLSGKGMKGGFQKPDSSIFFHADWEEGERGETEHCRLCKWSWCSSTGQKCARCSVSRGRFKLDCEAVFKVLGLNVGCNVGFYDAIKNSPFSRGLVTNLLWIKLEEALSHMIIHYSVYIPFNGGCISLHRPMQAACEKDQE